jgi:ribonuclease P protein component
VVRNRLRRQLRVVARAAAVEGELPGGWYLVIVAPGAAGQPMATLSEHFAAAVDRLTPRGSTTGALDV